MIDAILEKVLEVVFDLFLIVLLLGLIAYIIVIVGQFIGDQFDESHKKWSHRKPEEPKSVRKWFVKYIDKNCPYGEHENNYVHIYEDTKNEVDVGTIIPDALGYAMMVVGECKR